MRTPTMREVAALAGVSIKTVSRFVNGDETVSRAIAERVRAAIDETGYRRNDLARSLRPGQRSTTLALLVGDLSNPFYGSIANGVMSAARAGGHNVVLASSDEDPEAERRSIDDLLGQRVAGLLIVPGAMDYGYLGREVAQGTPVVFLDRPALGLDADTVLLDNHGGARKATEHLIAAGHRRIGVVVAASYHTTGRRLDGYLEAVRAAFGEVDEALIARLEHGTRAEAEEATAGLLALPPDRRPTALFTTTNFLTYGALRAMGAMTPQPGPEQGPALVGFDDFPFADLLPTPVTVVSGDAYEMGREAARLLLARLAGESGPPRRVELGTVLTPRGSGELTP
ncbi:LacI family DNA-binding transcriptional regulator [Streptomyces sp. ME02-8801-2C]|uniref:LacI family DNA-binding transcriptional regulator n=1 Tax=Streptomyces sp. ME02-8801-2C TaxID=3028680 RepID=UPI0029B3851E|nr:LacI family DNA-binding transcriptional regulator [Streptomyces sp. ME02-8801-2C]MDX3453515.1 LacI family DNA-binding transcriptional regulator [Streptomyces sp. ME02-8801-2C]